MTLLQRELLLTLSYRRTTTRVAPGQYPSFRQSLATKANWAKPLHWLDVQRAQSTLCEFPASPPARRNPCSCSPGRQNVGVNSRPPRNLPALARLSGVFPSERPAEWRSKLLFAVKLARLPADCLVRASAMNPLNAVSLRALLPFFDPHQALNWWRKTGKKPAGENEQR